MRIAASSAQFGFLGHGKGIPPSYAAARSVLSPGTARDLCVTGRVVGAEDALKLGIVSEVTADADLMTRAMEIAEGVAASPRPIILEMKRRFLADQAMGVDELMREEETFLENLIARVRKMMALRQRRIGAQPPASAGAPPWGPRRSRSSTPPEAMPRTSCRARRRSSRRFR